MIARCAVVLLFAAVATACPGACGRFAPGCGLPAGFPGCGLPAGYPGCGAPVFRVALDNCGPAPLPLPVLPLPGQITPTIEKPVIPLPACIPPPRTVNNVCSCVKTIVKPQVYQQLVHVPAVQRYLQTSHTPVVENIQYQAVPVNCPPFAPEVPAFLPGCGCAGLPAYPGCAAPCF